MCITDGIEEGADFMCVCVKLKLIIVTGQEKKLNPAMSEGDLREAFHWGKNDHYPHFTDEVWENEKEKTTSRLIMHPSV